MAVDNAGRLVWASAFALLLLGGCATETQGLQEDEVSLTPNGGSAGSAGNGGATGGSDPVGAAGTFVSAGTGGTGNSGGMGGGGPGTTGGGGAGGGIGGGGASAGGGAGGKAGGGGMGGAAGTGGASANPCETGKLGIDAATASSEENAGLPASQAFDGNGTSRWASAHFEPEWIYFDLGEVAHVSRVLINWEVAYATSYRLELADDSNGPWLSIFQENAGDGAMDNITTLTAHSGRYVRMYGITRATMYGFSIWEFEIYGDLDETCK